MVKEQVTLLEFEQLSPKERLQKLADLSRKFENPQEQAAISKEDRNEYATALIAVQHLMVDINQKKPLTEGQKIRFAAIISKSLANLSEHNILLPIPEQIAPISEKSLSGFVEHLTQAKKIIDTVKKDNQEISQEQKDSIVAVILSFQHFMCRVYRKKDSLTITQQSSIVNAIEALAILLPELSAIGIKIPASIETSQTQNTENKQPALITESQPAPQPEKTQPSAGERLLQTATEFGDKLAEVITSAYETYQTKQEEKRQKEIQRRKEKREQRRTTNTEKIKKLKNGDVIFTYDDQEKLLMREVVIASNIRSGYVTTRVEYSSRQSSNAAPERDRDLAWFQSKIESIDIMQQLEFDYKSMYPGHYSIANTAKPKSERISPNSQQEKLFYKANQDVAGAREIRVGYSFDPESSRSVGLRLIVADGSGGSSSFQRSSLVTEKMRTFMQTAFSRLSSLRDATFQAANTIYQEQASVHERMRMYGTFVAADILKDKIDICWRGDSAALLWSDSRFNHRRSDFQGDFSLGNKDMRGDAAHFQLQNFLDHTANISHASEKGSSKDMTKTMVLDVSPGANVVMRAIGAKELKSNKEISLFSIPKEQVQKSNAQFLLLCTDGAQPNRIIGEEKTPAKLAQAVAEVMDQVYSERRKPLDAAGIIQTLPNRNLGNVYSVEVNRIMQQLQAGQLSTTEASKRISLASRVINQDKDDITVQIVDLRRWAQN